MEINEDGFLEELLSISLGRETWEGEINGLFTTSSSCWSSLEGFDGNSPIAAVVAPPPPPLPILPNSYDCFTTSSIKPDLDCSFNHQFLYGNQNLVETAAFPTQPQPQPQGACKLEEEMPGFNMGVCVERERENKESKSKVVKRVEGQPSKNLMAERRRRKRLNDRLSMLRSIVPKISKMDRTSILGDTIDYMKELLERINTLQEEILIDATELNEISIFKDLRQNDTQSLIKNSHSPKFDVEMRNSHTRVEMSCSGKQGLLMSTVTTLEALGLEIQQCVISCFNDFSLHAACSQDLEQTSSLVNSEDIKQALFRNAGYGGRCL